MAASSVRLDQELIEKATIMAKAYNRATPFLVYLLSILD